MGENFQSVKIYTVLLMLEKFLYIASFNYPMNDV